MRRLLGTLTIAVALSASLVACGGDDDTAAPTSTTTTTVKLGDNGLTGAAAVDKYCQLVTQALAAAKGKQADETTRLAKELRDAYIPAFRATKTDATLVQRFVDCARLGTAKSPVTTAAGGDGAPSADPTPETATTLVGLSESEAEAAAKDRGWSFRVGERDGQQFPLTKDYRADRVTVTVADDKVISVAVG